MLLQIVVEHLNAWMRNRDPFHLISQYWIFSLSTRNISHMASLILCKKILLLQVVVENLNAWMRNREPFHLFSQY